MLDHVQLQDRPFESFPGVLFSIMARYADAVVLELGAGRFPSYSLSELPANVRSYCINDIDFEELERAPSGYETHCFDAIGDVSQFEGQYDVVFSRTLAEHVKDGEAFHRNVFSLLKPGGVAVHMIPTLYSPPFVLNMLMPEQLSRRILLSMRPSRRSAIPKFPAYYSWCYGNRRTMIRLLEGVGFAPISIRTFYKHDYFASIPLLNRIDEVVTSIAKRKDWSWLAAYAHVIAHKG